MPLIVARSVTAFGASKKLSCDKSHIIYNDSLSIGGIPPETFEYKLGNRAALDWVIDQYRIKVDKRSGIVNDPNRLDEEEYIVRLIGKVVFVSLETVDVLKDLENFVLCYNYFIVML